MKQFVRFGNNPNLSWAELRTQLISLSINFEIVVLTKEVAILDIEDELDAEFLNTLGGSVKCGIIIDNLHSVDEVVDIVKKDLSKIEDRKVFGFSLVGVNKKDLKRLDNLGMELKKELKPARFVVSKLEELSSVIVTKEKLIEKGGDYNIIQVLGHLYLGKTVAVQDFKAYDRRDYGRPAVDAKSGMLPPKLAQMMINLIVSADKDITVLDPFCGSGTLLQELLVKGYTRVIGSDVSEKAIDDSKTNLEWLEKEFGLSVDNVELYNVDAKEIAQHVDQVDVIVTEPYLGPPLKGGEHISEIEKNKRDLEELYMRVFKTFSHIVKSGGEVIIVVPAFITKNGMMYLDIENKLKSHGFTLQTGYKDLAVQRFRYPLMYFRPDQKVYREIMVFKKK